MSHYPVINWLVAFLIPDYSMGDDCYVALPQTEAPTVAKITVASMSLTRFCIAATSATMLAELIISFISSDLPLSAVPR
jgi:hypothetical protein